MAPPGIFITTAAEVDAASLATFAARTFRETFGCDNTSEDMDAYVALHFNEQRQRAELRDPSCLALLVHSGTQLVGYAQLMESSDPPRAISAPAIEIQRFYVESAHHGTGIAQALMRECIVASSDRGFAAVWLGVWERNPRAIAFYRKSGFVDLGSQPFVLGDDLQTDRIMLRSL
ncbi:MAG: GNAT family N-acetyltransferase [Gemmatimonadota bacterium]|nr:GNAT family N-acetyltransferase [Gemmatimonadota bacterium]